MRKLVVGLFLVLITGTVWAEEGIYHAEEAHHPNHVGLFLGVAHNGEAAATDFAAGIDYEYALAEPIGVGIFAERVFAEHAETLIGIPISYTVHRLQLFVAPAVLFAEAPAGEATAEASSEQEFLVRVGAGYEFELAGASLTPKVNLDFVNGEMTLVPGLAVGIGF